MYDTQNQEQAAPQTAAPAAAPEGATPSVPQPGPVPTPEEIQKMVEGHARVVACGRTFNEISGQAQSMLTSVCAGNPRTALAVANELVIFYGEVLRRSIQINHAPAPAAAPAADAGAQQDNTAPEKGTEPTAGVDQTATKAEG